MTAINFPDSPTLNQEFTVGDRTWTWDGSAWASVPGTISLTDVGVTATATELNYVDGVTSGVQTQLNGKLDEANGAVTTADTSSTVVRNITLSTSAPSGGADGDVWMRYY